MTAGTTRSSTSFNGTSASSGAPADALLASDAAACAPRGYEVQQLAARVAACADRADALLAQLVRVELQGWQSPAGRAYRTSLSLQAAALNRSRTALREAVAAVLRHARNVAMSPGRPGY
ncbi:hypothetical protein [Arthrobacter sp. PsM3]|uniref:hypothetical protein n=1 Tax=Arthrobacter sp. PsM3 TaxID=3030531 RepID=UPI00263A93C0|nr:hypothetical protein [Arthrobacter sp. PsM3]MDN4643213.1 hypothetical protein [Arthrobacter sp. PsM3]